MIFLFMKKMKKMVPVDFAHNPFSMPQGGLEALNNKDPFAILAYQYDFCM